MLRWRPYDELSRDELHDLLQLRGDVFVVEQRSIYPDIDGHDPEAFHLLVRDDDGRLIGTARLLPLPPGGPCALVVLGRFALRADRRGTGLGAQMVASAVAEGDRRFPGCPQVLGAQAHMAPFYGRFGFEAVSEPYDDGGILHVDMRRVSEAALPEARPAP